MADYWSHLSTSSVSQLEVDVWLGTSAGALAEYPHRLFMWTGLPHNTAARQKLMVDFSLLTDHNLVLLLRSRQPVKSIKIQEEGILTSLIHSTGETSISHHRETHGCRVAASFGKGIQPHTPCFIFSPPVSSVWGCYRRNSREEKNQGSSTQVSK